MVIIYQYYTERIIFPFPKPYAVDDNQHCTAVKSGRTPLELDALLVLQLLLLFTFAKFVADTYKDYPMIKLKKLN